jgi:hypothetical protein
MATPVEGGCSVVGASYALGMLLDIFGLATAVLLFWVGVRVLRHPNAFRKRFDGTYDDKTVTQLVRWLPPLFIIYGVLVIALWLFAQFRG